MSHTELAYEISRLREEAKSRKICTLLLQLQVIEKWESTLCK